MRHQKVLLYFDIEADHLIPPRRTHQVIISKKKMKKNNLISSEFCRSNRQLSKNIRKRKDKQIIRPCKRAKKIPAEHEVIPIVICAFGKILKDLESWLEELEISGRIVSIQTIAFFFTSARILTKGLENWGDLLSLRLQWKTTSCHWREKKNLQGIKC